MAGELVLVVEDNERNRRLVSDVLTFAGIKVISAATASEGIAMAREHLPQLVLMDVGLPDRDGVSALRDLRSYPETAKIPVVAVTAYAMEGDREALLGEGFDGYLAKPIDAKTFPEQVAAFLATAVPAGPASGPAILVVDDVPANARLLEAMLTPHGYHVVVAHSGREALEAVRRRRPHLVLLDVQMPDMDGYEVCRRLRSDPSTATVPVVMVTASVGRERLQALEAGADDFVSKPFNQSELLARISNLVKIRDYQERIESQATELARLNRSLRDQVDEQVLELERVGRLRRFVSPHVAEAIVTAGNDGSLAFHRAEIAALFIDLRGFTSFTGSAEPEESARVMSEYHEAVGELVRDFDATVGHFAGDGIMLFFNDPVPIPDPTLHAVRMSLALRGRLDELGVAWRRRGYELGCGVGLSSGFATVGEMGFEGRRDYGAIGSVCNLASRLCDEASGGQILISGRTYAEVEDRVLAEPLGGVSLKGFSQPVEAWSVLALKESS